MHIEPTPDGTGRIRLSPEEHTALYPFISQLSYDQYSIDRLGEYRHECEKQHLSFQGMLIELQEPGLTSETVQGAFILKKKINLLGNAIEFIDNFHDGKSPEEDIPDCRVIPIAIAASRKRWS